MPGEHVSDAARRERNHDGDRPLGPGRLRRHRPPERPTEATARPRSIGGDGQSPFVSRGTSSTGRIPRMGIGARAGCGKKNRKCGGDGDARQGKSLDHTGSSRRLSAPASRPSRRPSSRSRSRGTRCPPASCVDFVIDVRARSPCGRSRTCRRPPADRLVDLLDAVDPHAEVDQAAHVLLPLGKPADRLVARESSSATFMMPSVM